MGSLRVILLQIPFDRVIEEVIAEADEVVEAFMLDGAGPSFGVGVHYRSTKRDPFGLATGSARCAIKIGAELYVTVPDHEQWRGTPVFFGLVMRQLCLMCHPFLLGEVRGDCSVSVIEGQIDKWLQQTPGGESTGQIFTAHGLARKKY